MNSNNLITTASFTPDLLKSPSGWLGHLPFSSWVIQEASPKIFVELGTHFGHSYFSFCQAVAEAGLSTKCYAVDTWQGDEHAGLYGNEIFPKVDAYHQKRYAGFSRLLRMTFDDAASYFADESVELLHIDGLHTYEAVRHDFETWLPKLAPGAVVMFHDTNVRERNFGVWKLWEELQARYPNNVEFVHSHGLGVLQLNNAPDNKTLEWLQSSSPEKQRLINYFAALGSCQLERFELNELKKHTANLNQAVAERDGQITGLTQDVHDKEVHIGNITQMVAEHHGQIVKLNQAVTNRDGQIVNHCHTVTECDGQIAGLNLAAANLNHAVTDRDGQIVDLNQAVAERDLQIANLNSTIYLMHHSTSWRLTQPLRMFKRLLNIIQVAPGTKQSLGMPTLVCWLALQKKLIQKHGVLARLKALVKKPIKKTISLIIVYVKARPMLRIRLFNLARKMGISNRLRSIYEGIQTFHADGGFPLYQQVVSSYPVWSEQFDTPNDDTIKQLEASTRQDSTILIIAHFDETSEKYAEELAVRLVESVGQQWQAVFVFCPNCKSQSNRGASNADARISVNPPHLKTNAEFVLLIQGGALPRTHALRIFADALRDKPGALVAFSDENQYHNEAAPSNPWFKPTFSPLLASQGVLLGRMLALRPDAGNAQTLFDQLTNTDTSLAAFAQKYSLDAGEARVIHIPHVLFHDALGPPQPLPMNWPLPNHLPAVSIIIPTRDRWDLLGPCLESIKHSDWPSDRLEIIIVDNGSTDPLTLKMLAQADSSNFIKVIRDDMQFNWSRLNNVGVRESSSELLLFMNNDTEVIDQAWLKKLAVHALRSDTGAVGCKLLYPDRTVQHGGVIAGIQGLAGHAHLFLQANEGGYRNLANLTHEVAAVTGACLAVTRENFEAAGGFNENFRVAFNDIVFCFALHTLGKRNVYVADPLLIHHESKSRGYDDTPEKVALLQSEARKAWALHPQLLRDDPFYSPNLSLMVPYELSFAPRRRAYWDDQTKRPLRIMMLSITHAVGHGVAVVVALQAEALVRHGYEVIIAGPRTANDFPYPGCERVEVHDPQSAATLAASSSVDLIIAHTPPFFGVARWTGAHPPVLAYDYGEPPPEWFPDAAGRQSILAEKDQALIMATSVFAISDAVAAESRTPVHGVIPLGNSHLGQWNDVASIRRQRMRMERGWNEQFVILNVCRFHSGERLYKGVDTYADLRDALQTVDPELSKRTIFVLCGKGSPEDVVAMTKRGLIVAANVSDEEMADLYCAADAYANFSKWEGYNLGIGQALAMGLPTLASDIPAHRAFGIEVINQVTIAAEWLIQTAAQGDNRTPRIWNWEVPLSKLIVEINSICENRPSKSYQTDKIFLNNQCRKGGGEMHQIQQPDKTTESA